MTDSQDKKQSKSPVKIVLNVLLWVFLVFALITMLFAFMSVSNDNGVPTIGNKVVLNVKTDSMYPTIKAGDMILGTTLTGEEKASLKAKSDDYAGDIITFWADLNGDGVEELNTHRIIAVNVEGNGTYRTKGDNNELPDNYTVYDNKIICVWHDGDTRIAGLGAVIGFLQSKVGFFLIIILPLAAFFIYELVKFILLMVQIKNGDKKKISAEEEAIRERLYNEYLLKQQQNSTEQNTTGDNATENKE